MITDFERVLADCRTRAGHEYQLIVDRLDDEHALVWVRHDRTLWGDWGDWPPPAEHARVVEPTIDAVERDVRAWRHYGEGWHIVQQPCLDGWLREPRLADIVDDIGGMSTATVAALCSAHVADWVDEEVDALRDAIIARLRSILDRWASGCASAEHRDQWGVTVAADGTASTWALAPRALTHPARQHASSIDELADIVGRIVARRTADGRIEIDEA